MSSPVKKKILVRAPSCQERIVLSFPFFHELHEAMGQEEIHVVVDEEKAHAFRFMPKKFNLHPLPMDKRSIAGIHHFVVNLKDVFNVDLYMDLDNSFKSAFMGVNFRGRERVGLARGPQKLLFNHKVLPASHPYVDQQYLEILNAVTQAGLQEGRKYTPRELIEVVERLLRVSEDVTPDFLLVMAQAQDFDARFELWSKVLSQFEGVGIKVCLLGPQGPERVPADKKLEAIRSWPSGAQVEFIPFEDTAALVKALVMTKGVLADTVWAGQLAAYYGVESFIIAPAPVSCQATGCFVQRPQRVALDGEGKVTWADIDGRKGPLGELGLLMDIIHERFRL